MSGGKAARSSGASGSAGAHVPVTTLMFRNLPRKYTTMALAHELEGVIPSDKWDFLYLPWDANTPLNMGYAFVNFVDEESARYVQQRLDGKPWRLVYSYRAIKIVEAHVQGLQQNLLHCAHKVAPDTDPAHAPLVFYKGEQIDFQAAVRMFGRPKSNVAQQQKAQLQMKKKQYKEQQELLKQSRMQAGQRAPRDAAREPDFADNASLCSGPLAAGSMAASSSGKSPQELAREVLCPSHVFSPQAVQQEPRMYDQHHLLPQRLSQLYQAPGAAADSLWPVPAGRASDALLEFDFNDELQGPPKRPLLTPSQSSCGARGAGCAPAGAALSFRGQCPRPQVQAAMLAQHQELEIDSGASGSKSIYMTPSYQMACEQTAAQLRELLGRSGFQPEDSADSSGVMRV